MEQPAPNLIIQCEEITSEFLFNTTTLLNIIDLIPLTVIVSLLRTLCRLGPRKCAALTGSTVRKFSIGGYDRPKKIILLVLIAVMFGIAYSSANALFSPRERLTMSKSARI